MCMIDCIKKGMLNGTGREQKEAIGIQRGKRIYV